MDQLFSKVSTALLLGLIISGCGSSDNSTTGSVQTGSGDGVGDAFVNFETGQVRPLALSADGSRLFATNTPNSTLDIFIVTETGLEQAESVAVGLEPVSVATYGDNEVWVVNHLSDSISVVDVSVSPARIIKTLLVGDEPRDIVFAGEQRQLAFITAAHRGQIGPDDNPIDAKLQTPGVGRADLWAFDAEDTGTSLGGDPLSVTTLFADSLRGLATSPDGSRVYAAAMHSGNQTTAIGEIELAKPGPTLSNDAVQQPDTGLIVQLDGDTWRDDTGNDQDLNGKTYNSLVPFSLPDYDVFQLTAEPSPTVQRRVTGVGTTIFNLAVNPVSGDLYVSNTEALNVNRFEGHSKTTSTVTDLESNSESATVALHNPEPEIVKAGREFLYDATDSSSHGDASCGLCHVFGDTDALAWDLGNPDANVVTNPNAFVSVFLKPADPVTFHPLKGPMTTQSLRGLENAGPMHWRGDRTGQNATGNESIELAAFKEFNLAFPDLLGRQSPLSNSDMQKFAQFALTINYPPNPIRALDNSLTDKQARGLDTYMNESTTGEVFKCNDCHTLDPDNGSFGTSGLSSVEGDDISQQFKVPHLRNMYQKVGKFGNSGRFSGTDGDYGPQVRGFGFMHDGNMDTLDNFFKGDVFRFSRDADINETMRSEVVDFVMAFDSNMAPIVGQQVTLSNTTGSDTDDRIELLIQRSSATATAECDLIAKGTLAEKPLATCYRRIDSLKTLQVIL